MNLIEALNWRYATKRMNGQTVPETKLESILESIRLSPSSGGLQPYNIIAIDDQELKEKIKPLAKNQPQITEASHLLIFAAWDNISPVQIEEYINLIATTRDIDPSSLDMLKSGLMSKVGLPADQNFEWNARQAYIAFGIAIAAAALQQVDASPMEGFDPAAIDNLLGLNERGLKSVTILALGYRDAENDWLAPLKKVRYAKEKLFVPLAANDLKEAV